MKRNLKMNTSWLRSSIAAVTLLMLTACSSDETDVNGSQTSDDAIRFEAGSPETYRTRAAINSDGALQIAGFGVFAYYTEATEWATKSGNPEPNFMNNQQVTYSSGQWTYTPTKYWPNDNNPADTDGATGSQTHSYLSFFAYAPYQASVSLNTTTHQPEVTYTWPNQVNPASQQDLLYDNTKTDCYKTMTSPGSYGTTTGRVPFVFKHALSAIEFKVRRKTATGSPIFMKGLTLQPSSINTGGTFNLVEASWNTPFTTPSTMPTITYAPADILAGIQSGRGITESTDANAHNLTNYTPNLLLMMPHEAAVTFSFTINYTIGGSEKTPSGSFTILQPSGGWALAMGKKYTVVFVIDGDEVDSYLLREAEAEQW